MTPGDNGASTPEDEDPFGYLYADGQARGAQPPSGGYGYPNSVSRVRTVGERQYGGQQPTVPQQGAYGQPTGAYGQQQTGYGQPNAHYQAPETFPGGAPTTQQSLPQSGGHGRGSNGPNTKGLLIGAIAVVAAVVIGISVAMINGNSDDDKSGGDQAGGASPAQSQSASPSTSSGESEAPAELPTPIDAKALRLAGTAALAKDVQGAQSSGGTYVGGLGQVGSSVTWTVDNIPANGAYTLFVRYSAVGEDQSMTLSINGKPFGSKLNLANFTHQDDPAKAWTQTFAYPTLNKGTNVVSLSCEAGDKCDVLLDQLWLKQGQVKK
ncbi:carbohydrate-binding protein [Streptomyces brasiliensis]|uniref:CBM6 domain-containing protein n=1 Tax=Streptomyces brasiliensis TaxID=1954 RepID=A0A917KW37_9ACTN|nr:carbohydrate-binding protein [Streptomyces brasiliensis]GGJ30940.1 hypothetical protein GCM10010121_047860 [Streptomyces brasiliensis]